MSQEDRWTNRLISEDAKRKGLDEDPEVEDIYALKSFGLVDECHAKECEAVPVMRYVIGGQEIDLCLTHNSEPDAWSVYNQRMW